MRKNDKKKVGVYHKEVFDWDENRWNIKKGDKVQVKIYPGLLKEAKLVNKEMYDNVLWKKRNFDRKIGIVKEKSAKELGLVYIKFPNGVSETFLIEELRTR